MAGLTIPEHYRHGIASIGTISDGSFADLVSALQKFPDANTVDELAAKIHSDVPSLPDEVCIQIISALASMQGVQKASHVEPVKFAADVWDALEEEAPELSEGVNADQLKDRVNILVGQTSIHLPSVKVSELRREVERQFCGARILTDLRTAFPDDATKKPVMSVLHTLEIKFHDDMARHREFYVSLDDGDLTVLKEAVERAMQKKATLVDLLTKAKFELF